MNSLKVGTYYNLDYPKGKKTERRVMLYQGQDLGRNHTFVSDQGMYKVAENRIESINAQEKPQPVTYESR